MRVRSIATDQNSSLATALTHCKAAIAAAHAEAESSAATDWRRIVALYDELVRIHPSPVVQLNRAVAAMRDGPEAGLTHIDALLAHRELANYYLANSVRADMYGRLGRTDDARSSYEKALALTQQEPERQFLPATEQMAWRVAPKPPVPSPLSLDSVARVIETSQN